MPRNQAPCLRERKTQEELYEREIQRVFRERDKPLESVKRDKKQKRKSVNDLLRLLNLNGIAGAALRPVEQFQSRTYNLDRQLVGLLNHMYAKYPAPSFLYQACLQDDGSAAFARNDVYRQWFLTIVQGGSFQKLVKGELTGKEAGLFLSAPAGRRIHDNVWWAKMKVAGVPDKLIDPLIDKIFTRYLVDIASGLMEEIIRFYARYASQMHRNTFGEITDFLDWKLRQTAAFSMKGRTLTSVIKLSNEWHALVQKARLGEDVRWEGMAMPEWEFEAKDKLWTVTELLNNRELLNEGRKQKHCVYSYVHRCASGMSSVFSMRSFRKMVSHYNMEGYIVWRREIEIDRITIEVNRQQAAVVQVRGPLNRMPTIEEKTVLRYWSGEKGLRLMG